MKFGDKLRQERTKAGLTQEELSLRLGVTCRTLQNYESGTVYPKKRELYARLAGIFDTDVNYWLTETPEPAETEKSIPREEAQVLASQISSLFHTSDMTEAELDDFMRTIQQTYWSAKDKNKNAQK